MDSLVLMVGWMRGVSMFLLSLCVSFVVGVCVEREIGEGTLM